MKFTVVQPVEIEVEKVIVSLPIRYGDEEIPNDFPGREGDTWLASIMIGSGQILGWPEGREERMHVKVTDGGSYALYSSDSNGCQCLAQINQDYVPHGVIPGEYGDYVILDIGGDGVIKNWPSHPDVSEFFAGDDD